MSERNAPGPERLDAFKESVRAHLQPGDFIQRYSLIIAWGVVVAVFGGLRPDTFLTSSNFAGMFGTQAIALVLALALLIPLTAGDYDLSVAATLTLSQMTVAILNAKDHWNIYLVIVIALAIGAGIGFINGAIVVLVGIDPFIVTLGTGTFLQGVVLWVSNSETISGISDSLVTPVFSTRFLTIPLMFWYGIALMAALWYVFEFTPVGRRLLFVGRGRSVSRLSGIRVGRVRWGALVASGFIAAGAGVLYAGQMGAADPTSGLQYLLPAFAAAFLGATAIMPGRFNPIGTTIAVFFLATGINGLMILNVPGFVQQLFYGGALVVAVALTQLASRRQGASGVPTAGS